MISTVINLDYSVFLKLKTVSKEAPSAWKLKLVYSSWNMTSNATKHMKEALFFMEQIFN